jgi:hypothetical protein
MKTLPANKCQRSSMVSNVNWGMASRSILFSTWKNSVRLRRRTGPARRWLEANVIDRLSLGHLRLLGGSGLRSCPLKFLARIGLTDLSAGGPPDNPGAEFEQIAAISSKAFSKLNEGGILVHCVGGRGRTGTIIGAILRHCGYSAAEVIDFLDAAYRAAGRPGWPESSWQSQVVERVRHARESSQSAFFNCKLLPVRGFDRVT